MLRKRRGRPLTGLDAVIEPDLVAWGVEARSKRGLECPMDWPEENSLAKFIREGAGAGQSGGQPAPMSDRSLAIDCAIAQLPGRLREAIKLFYMRHQGNEKVCMYQFGRGNRAWRMALSDARRRIAAMLLPN